MTVQVLSGMVNVAGNDGGGGGDPPPSSDNYVIANESTLQTADSRKNTWPWSAQYNTLINRANTALNSNLRSVVDDGANGYNVHRFVANVNERADYKTGVAVGNQARDCALAYWFTGNNAYANKVVDILHHFCLKSSTYMIPDCSVPGGSGAIRQHIWAPKLIIAASFVRGHSRWGTKSSFMPWRGSSASDAEAAFDRWLRDWYATFPSTEPSWCPQNNRWPWRIVNIAALAAYWQDDNQMTFAKRMFKAEAYTTCTDGTSKGPRPWTNYQVINSNEGFFSAERNREEGFQYTNYNILAFSTCCIIFEQWDGTNLWDFNPSQRDPHPGSTLKKAFDWQHYRASLTNVSVWNYDAPGVVNDFGDMEQAGATEELAYYHWGDSKYKNALTNMDKAGNRPHWDRRIIGPTTLLYGRP